MALDASNIVFVQSVNMSDVPEGGGPPSANVLISGTSNDIVPDISEERRTVGGTEIYQIHSMLRNNDRSALMGANCILARPPEDPNVSIVLMSLHDPFATREDITKRIESGMSPGPEISGYLLENVQATMRSIRIFQRKGAAPPAIGKTLVLVSNEGLPSERSSRVRVKAIDTQIEWFTDVINGQTVDYEAQVTKCDLFDGLQYSFDGSPPSRYFARKEGKALIRSTVYSDSGMYYSAARLTAPVLHSDNWIQIQSPYVQLVPNTTTEVSSADQRPAARSTLLLAEAPRRVEVGVTPHSQRILISEENSGLTYVAQLRPLPDVATVTVDYFVMGQRYTLIGDASGSLKGAGAGVVSALTGTLDLTLQALPDIGTQITISWGSRIAYTDRSGQASFRAPEYSFALDGNNPTDQVVPGSLSIQYSSGNVVQTITDDGAGNLTGGATGTIDYPSRFLVIRPTKMPDSGSQFQIDCSLDSTVTEIFPAPAIDGAGVAVLTLAQAPVAGSVQVDWVVARTVSSTNGGTLDTTTAIKATTSVSTIEMQHVASVWDRDLPTTVVDPSIDWRPRAQGTGGNAGNPTDIGVLLDGYKPVTVWRTKDAGSSQSKLIEQSGTTSDKRIAVLKTLTDDGRGKFLGGLGTANYVGKQLMVQLLDGSKSTSSYQSDHEDPARFASSIAGHTTTSTSTSVKGGSYSTTGISEESMGAVQVSYRLGSGSPSAKTQTYTPPAVTIDLCPLTTDSVIAESVMFRWMGAEYKDFEGVIYRDRTSSSAGIECGVIDYAAGIASMYDYVVGGTGPADFQLLSLFTRKGQWSTASTFFSTEAIPLRAGPGGFVLSVVDLQGAVITANVDGQGNIKGQHLLGKVEFAQGGIQLQFGDYLLDSTLTPEQKQEWWYKATDVGAVEAGKIWRPWPVDPTSIRYSTVSRIYLPVDVRLSGIDPAALPVDGRVIFVRPGDLCVLGKNIGQHSPAFVPVIGDVYSLGAERLSFVQVLDSTTGAEIKSGYTVNLDAGTVTFNSLSNYPERVRMVARIEVYRVIAEVRIDGRIKLTMPVGHDFEVGDVFSTALRQGDRFARVKRVYDQRNWGGVKWVDGVDGEEAEGTYDVTNSPIGITNRGAITERWGLKFQTGGTAFDLIGQHLGGIAVGNVNQDFSPINKATGAPYFTLPAAGWGSKWIPGNAVFIDTVGAEAAIAIVRCVQPSSPVAGNDSFWLVQRGSVDRAPGTTF